MRIELVVLLIAGLIAFHIYTDGKYMKLIMGYKKYWQIAGVVVGALVLCWLLRRDPGKARDMLESTQAYLKYMPLDGKTTSWVSPLLDFTNKHTFSTMNVGSVTGATGETGATGSTGARGARGATGATGATYSEKGGSVVSLDGGSDQRRFKRSVSESKKKFVASRQKWLCNDCGTMLTATYEIDHIVRLDRGGTNHIDNLAALCPNCHRQKTMMENL